MMYIQDTNKRMSSTAQMSYTLLMMYIYNYILYMYIMTSVCDICAVEAQMSHTLVMMYIQCSARVVVDSTLHLVLFIQFILNSVTILYMYYLRGG